MTCVRCGQNKAHRSHRSGLKDRILRYFEYNPYRCHNCDTRFYAYRDGETSPKMRSREEQKIMQLRRRIRWQRSKRDLAVYSAGAFVLLAVLYEVMQQRISSPAP